MRFLKSAVTPQGDVTETYGIPDPDRCEFIGESEAIGIAKEAGLHEGIEPPGVEDPDMRPLSAEFAYDSKFDVYVWGIQNLTHAQPEEVGGEWLAIDACSGKILDRGRWEREPGYLSGAPEGTPLEVRASAVFIDDSGRLMSQGEHTIHVAGVEITVTDAEGVSQTRISTADDDVSFEILAGHNYAIAATFGASTASTQAVVKGWFEPALGIREGGDICVRVWHSSNTIESVSYYEPMQE